MGCMQSAGRGLAPQALEPVAPECGQPTESPVVQQPVSAVMTTAALIVNQESPLHLSHSM
jgi:hypothetical protein